MGGAPCKVVVDDSQGEGMALAFEAGYRGVRFILENNAEEYWTPQERKQSRALVTRAEELTVEIRKFKDRLVAFYKPLAAGAGIPFVEAKSEDPSMQFAETCRAINDIAFTLLEKLTYAETKAALALSYETCEFADGQVKPLVDEMKEFYVAITKKYEYTHDEKKKEEPDV